MQDPVCRHWISKRIHTCCIKPRLGFCWSCRSFLLLILLSLFRSFCFRSSFCRSSFFNDNRTTTTVAVCTSACAIWASACVFWTATRATRAFVWCTRITRSCLLPVATITATMKKTMTTTMTTTTVATMTETGNGTGVDADQSEGDQRNERRKWNSQKTLHFFLRNKLFGAGLHLFCRQHAYPTRDGHRSRETENKTHHWFLVGTTRSTPCMSRRLADTSSDHVWTKISSQNKTVKQLGGFRWFLMHCLQLVADRCISKNWSFFSQKNGVF